MKTLYRILLLVFGCLCILSAELKAQLTFRPNYSPTTVVANAAGGENPIFTADFNGDGIPDVVSIEASVPRGIKIMFINEVGTQLGAVRFVQVNNISDSYSSLLAVDYEGDRDLDIVTVINGTGAFANASRFVYIQNPGLGAFTTANVNTIATPTIGRLSGLVSLDINVDGFPDIMGISKDDPNNLTRLNLFLNDALGAFTYNTAGGVVAIAVPNPTTPVIKYFGMKKFKRNSQTVPDLVINGYQNELYLVLGLDTYLLLEFLLLMHPQQQQK